MITPNRHVIADIKEAELLDAYSMAFELGRLSCSVHQCNSPLHRYSIHQKCGKAGHSLEYIVEGHLTIVSDEYHHAVGPGDLVFLRSEELLEYHASSPGSKTIGIHVPWMLVEALAAGRVVALDRVFTGASGIGACVVSLIQAVFRSHPHLSMADGVALQRSLAELIVQLGTAADEPFADGGRGRTLENLKAIATLSLDDPELTPAKVAAEAGMSVRTLHRVFQETGQTFWNWIRDRRLERCYGELTTLSPRSITEVAFRWGFNDLSTFERSFRRRYGTSPRSVRSCARTQDQSSEGDEAT
ncbi:AraC-like DNA-binding protein [Ancylobacter sp. 3268]|uniref:AraC family transcriptional regulator n=1 Tax=Ancylobacter sp. 3268 TaxID=2817752 RepID=UPI00286422A2|nr:AraC family transcriptional regulator [Ancylobacter sp. 3268]MDR6955474.1 AraC-like DNA-binding protein [Ancylobacter sp. 3268]